MQNKTGAKRAIEIVGELKALIERIKAWPRERMSAYTDRLVEKRLPLRPLPLSP